MTARGRGWQEVTEVDDFLLRRGLGCEIREYYPEVNERGEATFAEQTRMQYGWCGAERLSETPDDDPWYDCAPGPLSLPAVDTSGWGRHRG